VRGVIWIVVLLGAAGCGGDDGGVIDAAAFADVELPAGVTAEMAARGEWLFNRQTCFTCHGRNATGAPLAPALNDQQWLNTDGSFDAIVAIIRDGVSQPVQYPSPMPPMGGVPLSEEQVRYLAAYVYAVSRGGG
jgi:mono/diheme cytochrome c family protein